MWPRYLDFLCQLHAPQLIASWTDVTKLHSTNKCFDSSTDDQFDVFGNIFFNYSTIGSHTCNKKATHISVSILKISCLDNHNFSTNWVVTAEDVLSVVRFAGSACRHFPMYVGNIKPRVWWNNEVKSSEQSFVSVLHDWISCDCHAFTISAGSGDRCPGITAQLICKQIRAGSTYLYKCSPYALNIASNPTNTC